MVHTLFFSTEKKNLYEKFISNILRASLSNEFENRCQDVEEFVEV